MKQILSVILILLGFTIHAQTDCSPQTAGWTCLEDNLDLPGLEDNPLKGIAANFNTEGTWSGFPHSIANKTFVYGELVNDNGTFDFSAIDAFIEKEAQFGRFSMIQVNVDNGELINPHIDDFYGEFEDPNSRVLGDYKGHQFDLPPFLDNVKRIYYLGKPQVEGQTQVTDETTGIRKNVFPWDVPRTEIVNGEEKELGDPQGNPSLLVDYNDAVLVNAMKTLIEALAAKYDNDDRMAIVHYGMYGIFGEWDLGAAKVYVDDLVNDAGNNLGLDFTEWIMTFGNQAVVINAYQNNFTQTNLVGRVPDLPNPQSVGYSDGLYFGASLSDDEAFSYFFHPTLISNNVDENWRNKMIGGEMDPKLQGAIWDRNYWETTFPQINQSNSDKPFDYSVFGDKRFTRNADIPQNVEEVFQQTHPTFIFQNYMMQNFFVGNEGDNHLTPNPLTAEEIEKFPLFGQNNQVFWDNAILATKKLGYTFYVDEFKLSASNGFPAVEVNIQNLGIAPMYANWEVELATLDASGNIDTIGRTSTWNLQGILPSVYKEGVLIEENIVNKRTLISDDDVLDGEYTFLLRIVNPLEAPQSGIRAAYSNAKPVRFANQTQDQDIAGWLTLGNATITNGELGEAPIVATSFTAVGPTTGLSMNLLSELQLAVTSVPANVPYEWRSNLPQIASVDQNGNVTSSESTPGDVIITAITTDGQEVVFEVTVTSYRDITDDINSATRIQGEFYSSIFEDGDGDNVNDPRKTPITGVEDFGEIAVTNTNNLQGPDGQDLLDENGELVGPYWIEFDIDVKVAAQYEIDFRTSSPFGANVKILVKGENETEYQEISTVALPALPQEEFIYPDPIVDFFPNGDPAPDFEAIYNVYKTSSFPINLSVGKQTIRLQPAGYNLNWIEFKLNPCFGFTGTVDANCDDGNPATLVDRFSNNCACEGTPVESFVDITNGGIIEAEDYSKALNVTKGPAPDAETSAQIVENFGTGDWLEYAVEIQGTASRNFELDFRASSPFGGTVPIQLVNDAGYNLISTTTLPVLSEEERIFQLDENGVPLLDENGVKLLDFGATFKIYKTTTSDIITLPPGKYILRLLPDGYNLNWIEFRADDSTVNDCTPLSLAESFNNTTGTYTVVPGAFSSPNATYESFVQNTNSVTLGVGGVDNSTQTNTSTGLSTAFTTSGSEDVVIQLDYELTVADTYESDEWTQVIATVDGVIVPFSGNDYLSELVGGNQTTTGALSVPLTLTGLAEGSHTLVVGLLNNAKTYNNELSSLTIENITISQACETASCTVNAPCDDGDPATASSAFNANCDCVADPVIPTPTFIPIPNLGEEVIEAESANFALFDNGTVLDDARVVTISAAQGDGGQQAIGFIENADKFEFSVSVEPGGASFELDLRAIYYSSPFDARVNILDAAGNTLTTSPVALGEGLPAGTYGTTTSPVFNLPEGDQVVAIEVVSSNFDLNWIKFRKDDSTVSDCIPLSLAESFNNTTGTYSVVPGAFSSPNATYESFVQNANSVTLGVGGEDNSTQTNTSTGLSTAFTTSGSEDVVIQLDYELTVTDTYESNEWTQVIATVDGVIVPFNGNDYLSELVGGNQTTTGALSVPLTLTGLAEGSHTLVVGLLNNVKTYNNEVSSLTIENISISQACETASCTVNAPCDDGDPATASSTFNANCDCVADPVIPTPTFIPIPNLGDEVIEAESANFALFDNGTTLDDAREVTISAAQGDGGQQAIGFIENADRFEFSVNVEPGGAFFELDIRAIYYSSPFDARVNILDAAGNTLTPSPVALGEGLPNGVYGTTTSPVFALPGGDQVITIEVVSSNFDLNWIKFKKDGTPVNDCTPLSIAESFNNTTGTYSVVPGAFSSPNATYESITQNANSVTLSVGGEDNSTQTNLSTGLSTVFTTNGSEDVVIQLDYELSITDTYESNEWTQVIVEVDGVIVPSNGNDFLSELVGGGQTTTGSLSVPLTLSGLTEGNHTLVVGLFNNVKTYNNEVSSLTIENIMITQNCPVSNSIASSSIQTTSTELNTIVENEVNVYPNPVEDQLHIDIAGSDDGLKEIKLFDLNGRLLYREQTANTSTTININPFNASGMILVQITNKDKQSIHKIFVK